jgi:hypothetical protein
MPALFRASRVQCDACCLHSAALTVISALPAAAPTITRVGFGLTVRIKDASSLRYRPATVRGAAQRDPPSTFAALFVEALAGVWMALAPMPGDVDAARHPHIFLRHDVVEEPL